MSSWNNHNIVKLLQDREKNSKYAKYVKRYSQFTESLVKRLGLEHELEGHNGCVNCLQWTSDGRYLASGSDDTTVIIWDPFRHKKLKSIPTTHIGNIFSVKFLGKGSLIATAAGDCRVIVQCLDKALQRQSPILDCSCHVARVKRLATAPDQPLLFWSAGEDGLVIQYDMREPHECTSQSTVFVDLSYTSEVKCIAVNPTRPHYVAIGADDCFIRMYDRRMVRTTPYRANHSFDRRKRTPPEPQDPSCVQYYAPGHLARDNGGDLSYKLACTYIAFNATGEEMLVNMGGEQIYLFDVNNARSINEIRVPQNLVNGKVSGVTKKCCLQQQGGDVNSTCSGNSQLNGNSCACDYLQRASKLIERQWTGDLYCAARDYLHVIQHWPDNMDAYTGLIKCLIALKWYQEANDWLEYCCKVHPSFSNTKDVAMFRENFATLKDTNNKKEDPDYSEKPLSDEEKQLRLGARDYELRFLGHCNTTTDIKEANFLGEEGKYICAGSDDGIVFIWDRVTTEIVHAFWGDVSIVNCVQPHPSVCFIASSGIDSAVKLWSPLKEDGSRNISMVTDLQTAIESNQARMSMDPFETMLANMGYRVRNYTLESASLQEIPGCRPS